MPKFDIFALVTPLNFQSSGWATSQVLAVSLVSYVLRGCEEVLMDQINSSAVDKAIESTFRKLDNEIVKGGLQALQALQASCTRTDAMSHIMPAKPGMTAVLALYDPTSSELRIASVSESGAVMGKKHGDAWSSSPISDDQTVHVESEKQRLVAQHPHEPNILAKD